MGPGTLPRIIPVELIILISRRGICNPDVAIEIAASPVLRDDLDLNLERWIKQSIPAEITWAPEYASRVNPGRTHYFNLPAWDLQP